MATVNCIFGPPGTGKTTRLIEECNRLLERNSRAQFLSFTRSAAEEAAGRIKTDRIVPSTLHALAYRTMNYGKSQVVDASKLQSFSDLTGIPFMRPTDNGTTQIGDEYLDVVSYARNLLIPVAEGYDHFNRPGTPLEFARFVREYDAWKSNYGYVDFNDMLANFHEAIECDAVHFPPVLILDEAQDCSPLQWRVIEAMTARINEVVIGGDDDQAIYEWGGADPHGMIKYAEQHDAKQETLQTSWRLPVKVWKFATQMILPQFRQRVHKLFEPRPREGSLERYGSFLDYAVDYFTNASDMMILVRDRYRMMEVQKILNSELVPYRVQGGYSPFDNNKSNAIRAVIKLSSGGNPDQREQNALATVLNDPYIKKGDYSRVLGRDWRDLIPLSAQNMEFYEAVDLLAPIGITVSTIHQAKGKEADTVVVDLELTDRVVMNLEMDRDAELRVMYVACTRAREALHLCADNPLI